MDFAFVLKRNDQMIDKAIDEHMSVSKRKLVKRFCVKELDYLIK